MSTLPPAPGKGPIFVMGSMGTGTTLLRLVLDSHDSIAIPPETGFMRAYKAHRFIPFKWTGRNWAKRLGWSDDEFEAEMRVFYDKLFMRYVETHGKKRWGEKTPLHIWHWEAMARMFPDAVFIAIVRHPGGSMASNMNRWRFGLARAASHFERYTRELLRQASRFPERTVMIRYEELLLNPEPLMRELLDWLGEPWSDKVLEHHVVQSGRGGKEVVEGRNRVSDPLDIARIDKWKATINKTNRRAVGKKLGRLPQFLGYSMTDAAVLEPVNSEGRMLTSGFDIKQRFNQFGELGLEVRGTVPWFEQLYHPRDFTLRPVETVERQRDSGAKPSFARQVIRPWVRALPKEHRARLARFQQSAAVRDRLKSLR
ncbi:MAG: hypothetical protein QOF76_4113 [Solirubrobacteraceae bacterium]|jgi:hypothetical protein|nr:hypothetical protein [Solirubrobacteraceae bacterium]